MNSIYRVLRQILWLTKEVVLLAFMEEHLTLVVQFTECHPDLPICLIVIIIYLSAVSTTRTRSAVRLESFGILVLSRDRLARPLLVTEAHQEIIAYVVGVCTLLGLVPLIIIVCAASAVLP